MLNTFTSYQLITKDISKSIDRIEQQPVVDRDTKYYLDNITKVKSIDDFVNNDRLFKYAMKAFGLEDMDYAKAFMVKALKEGVSDSSSFANKLTDKRYAEFVSAFNFAANGADATIYNKAQQLVTKNYAAQAEIAGVDPNSDYVKGETTYYLANITKVKSIDDLMGNSRLYTYALAAFGLDSATEDKDLIKQVLQGGVSDPDSVANKQTNPAYAAFASAFNFQAYGENATTYNPAQQPTVDKYMRQTLEEDAGNTNQGVRLALYFDRKAPTITSWYDVLADTALASVVRTALGLPEFLRHRRHRQAGAAVRAETRHLGFLRPGEARQVPDPLHQHVGDQQPDLIGRHLGQRAVCPAAHGGHLHRPYDGHAEAEVLKPSCGTACTSPFPRRSRSSAASIRSPTTSPTPRRSASAPPA